MRDDADLIRRMLDERLEALLDRYYPGHVVRGRAAYPSPKGPKDLGSFQVQLFGAKRGQWYRHSQKVGGGSVELICYALTNGVAAYDIAFKEARAFLGMSNDAPDDAAARARREREAEAAKQKRAQQERQEGARRARRAETAAEMWAECRPIAGTLAEAYLVGRGLPIPPTGWPDVLGLHPGLEHELSATWDGDRKVAPGPIFPCLVARVDDMAGDLTAIWRVFLDPKTGGKAPVDNPKVGFGPAKGGAVRLGGVAPHIGGGEGVESALAAWALVGWRYPVWSFLSTSGMVNAELPLGVKRLTLFPDGDQPVRKQGNEYVPESNPPGIKAARMAKERHEPAGIQVDVGMLPRPGTDYLDVWVSAKESMT